MPYIYIDKVLNELRTELLAAMHNAVAHSFQAIAAKMRFGEVQQCMKCGIETLRQTSVGQHGPAGFARNKMRCRVQILNLAPHRRLHGRPGIEQGKLYAGRTGIQRKD